NNNGQLGDGSYGSSIFRTVPEQILAGGVAAIAAGDSYSLFLNSDGSLWDMGEKRFGALITFNAVADGILIPSPEQAVPSGVTSIAAAGTIRYFIKSDGSLWGMSYDSAIYCELKGTAIDPVQIVAGDVAA